MFFLFLLLLFGTLFLLSKRGVIGAPPWVKASSPSPEGEAKRILAERFAKGDLTSDEFMERASVLNWTPGSEQFTAPKGKKKNR